MRRSLFLLTFCFSILPILPAVAQVQEEVRVDILEIWAKVTDKNDRVVSDLNVNDFQVLIDGKQAEIRCFDKTFYDPFAFAKKEEESISENSSDAPKRKYIFFFDLLNSSPRSVDYLKSQMVDFLNHNFTDEDEGMIFALLPTVHLGVVQKMTSNKESVISQIQKMRGNATLDARIRNNEKEILAILSNRPFATQQTERNVGVSNRNPEQIRQARGLARSYAAQDENLSRFTLNSFLSIAQYLQGNAYEGRLVMIYVSGGFSMRPGQNYFDIIDRAIDQTSLVGSEDLNFRDRPGNEFDHEVRRTIGTLNRLNVTIYSIDARGLIPYDRGPERDSLQLAAGFDTISYNRELQDSLVTIARETGGTAFVNTQNYQRGLAEMASDMNQQYWLCASLPSFPKRGIYHKIEVKVNRPGLNVRHRKGYIE
jgi:VWFA-related protein